MYALQSLTKHTYQDNSFKSHKGKSLNIHVFTFKNKIRNYVLKCACLLEKEISYNTNELVCTGWFIICDTISAFKTCMRK